LLLICEALSYSTSNQNKLEADFCTSEHLRSEKANFETKKSDFSVENIEEHKASIKSNLC